MADASFCSMDSPLPWISFYSDPQLAEFYFNRLRWHAKAGHILVSRRPVWRDGKGTVSAAMVHNTDPEIFERMTGLPYNLGLLLEMLNLTRESDIDMIASALRPGLDTSDVPAHAMRDWFADPDCKWSAIIDDSSVDELRLEWATACSLWLQDKGWNGWAPLLERMSALLEPGNAMRAVQNTILESLISLSPPPPPSAVGPWKTITLVRGVHSQFIVAQFAYGWRASDFAKETELFQWFTERASKEPGGVFTEAALRQAQEEWGRLPKDAEYIIKEEYFFEHRDSALAPAIEQLRNIVKRHLHASPAAMHHNLA
ncbi:MAG: hypothetical protein ACRYF9_26680 [Janthinobacterium lividum]